jgi:hypothetical protein
MVIASAAKQSRIAQQAGQPRDRHVAVLLAMTASSDVAMVFDCRINKLSQAAS